MIYFHFATPSFSFNVVIENSEQSFVVTVIQVRNKCFKRKQGKEPEYAIVARWSLEARFDLNPRQVLTQLKPIL